MGLSLIKALLLGGDQNNDTIPKKPFFEQINVALIDRLKKNSTFFLVFKKNYNWKKLNKSKFIMFNLINIDLKLFYSFLKKLNKDKIVFFYLPMLSFIMSILEVVGIAILIPITEFIFTDQSLTEKYFFLPEKFNYKLYLPIILILIFLIKALIATLIAYYQNIKLDNLNSDFSILMLKHIMGTQLFNFNRINNSEKIRLIHRESMYLGDFAVNYLKLVSSVIMALAISTLLIYTNYKAVIFIGILLSIIIVPYKISIKKISILSKKRVEQDFVMNNNLFKIINSFVTIKLYNKLNYFVKEYQNSSQLRANVISKGSTLLSAQSYFIELFLMIIISCMLLVINYYNLNVAMYLSTFVIFIASLIKLLPNINIISSSISQIKSLKNHLNVLQNFLDIEQEGQITSLQKIKLNSFSDKIIFKDVSFNYGKKKILKNLNFVINKNEIIAIKGESGRGKSTLLNLITGLLKPSSGEILIDNININELSNYHDFLSYSDQNIFLTNQTLKENIILGDVGFNKSKYQEIIKASCIEDLTINNLDQEIISEGQNNFSGGQIQRIALARTLYQDRNIVILDEFTSAIDSLTKRKILKNIFNKNKTYIIVSHDSEVINCCNRIIDLDINE